VARAGDTLKMDLKLFARADANVDAAQGTYTIEVVRKDWSCTGTYKGLFRDAETAGNVTGGVVPLKDEVVPKEPTEPPGRDFPGSPGCGEYYTRFIAPVVPFAIRGAIWDQGESGTGLKDISLPTLVSAMVGSWRKAWGADFPFFFVQKPSGGGWNWLPGRTDDKGQPVPRPALPASPQQVFKLEQAPGRLAFHDMERIPNSDMAIAMDLNDGLHPFDKIPYAQRVYRLALARAYGRPVEGRGPTLQSHAIEGERVRLVFKHVGAGLEARGGEPLQGFMIAGEGRVFHWAEAQIEGDAVLVSSPAVPQPAAVRYAWAESPSWANLFNKDGVPALPFRTDDWKGPVPAPRPASLVVTNATATPPPR
jgi:sialate O-acetylesterase